MGVSLIISFVTELKKYTKLHTVGPMTVANSKLNSLEISITRKCVVLTWNCRNELNHFAGGEKKRQANQVQSLSIVVLIKLGGMMDYNLSLCKRFTGCLVILTFASFFTAVLWLLSNQLESGPHANTQLHFNFIDYLPTRMKKWWKFKAF